MSVRFSRWHIRQRIRMKVKVGHLRVALTVVEFEQVPPGCAVFDAGESGPARPRTR